MKKQIKVQKMIQGLKADYSPSWFFIFDGFIYAKLKTNTSIDRNFDYPLVDQLKNKQDSYCKFVDYFTSLNFQKQQIRANQTIKQGVDNEKMELKIINQTMKKGVNNE